MILKAFYTSFFRNLVVLNLLMILFFSCQKKEQSPAICLSFDDNYIQNWEEILPLLEYYDARVTFFLNGINQLPKAEKNKLKRFKSAGHDIQAHGEMHTPMNTYIKSHGLNDYLEKEIEANLQALEKLGITPSVFAYPFGEKNKYIDIFLWTKFKATRNILSKSQLAEKENLIYRELGEVVFWYYSLGIDRREDLSETEILNLLDKAKSENKILFIHAHQLGEGDYSISKEELEFWLLEAKKRNLKFVSYSDLSN